MEFLVHIRIGWPHDMDPAHKESVSTAERAHAAELAARGHLVRMWRVPGRTENWGLWRAADATELHTLVSSLPVWPWMDVTVHPLAIHPVDPLPPVPTPSTGP
ncbi:muconolactone Delta-isomerase [Streptomyces sp. NPDC091377]|uniref:muconolactone Delta-isomerase n=1 Tax=Streptomyces sp. NPDC091377 TaxID=3365995 RepID=UPI003803995B